MKTRAFWATVCKVTCLGGSERGTCDCARPNACAARTDPGFARARSEAVARTSRRLRNTISETNEEIK